LSDENVSNPCFEDVILRVGNAVVNYHIGSKKPGVKLIYIFLVGILLIYSRLQILDGSFINDVKGRTGDEPLLEVCTFMEHVLDVAYTVCDLLRVASNKQHFFS